MKINCDKTQLMYVFPSASQKTNPILLKTIPIKHQDQLKILGFTLASDLKFDYHIGGGKTNMLKSINSKTAMLRAIKTLFY